MGQLCFREQQEFKNGSKNRKSRLGSRVIEKDPSKLTVGYVHKVENFENTTNEKKYFFSMFYYNKIQKKIQKIHKLSKKRSHEVSPSQIQKLCASLGQYIMYLQTIQENFQLYDQVYEESEKGYLESEAYSLTFEDSLRNGNFSYQQNQNSNGQSNNIWGICGIQAKQFNVVQSDDQRNNNGIEESGSSETIDHTQSTKNYNQILPKFYPQEIKEHLNTERISVLKIIDSKQNEDIVDDENSELKNNQKIEIINCNQQNVKENILLQSKSVIQNINDQQNEDNADQIVIREPVSCRSVLLFDMENEMSLERSNSNQNNHNNSSGHFSNCDRDQNLQTINEEAGQGNILFNSHIQSRNSILQLSDSNILSQISINDIQSALPNYEVSEIFGRISERLEQPLLIVEFHKLSHLINTRVASYRVYLEVFFEDGGKNQKLKFFTAPLYQAKTSGENCTIPDININEVFEFMSEIPLTDSSYTKFRVLVHYTPLNKQNKEVESKLNNKKNTNSPPQDKMNKSTKGSIGSNNGGYNEDKQVSSSDSQSSSNSNLAYRHNSNASQTTAISNNKDNNKNTKDMPKYNKATDQEYIEDLNSKQLNDKIDSDEIKISSQTINLKDYMDQKIHYLNLKFTNKSNKQKTSTSSINLTLQTRFQFVYDQISLVNNLMRDLNKQKSILEEVLTNISNPTPI